MRFLAPSSTWRQRLQRARLQSKFEGANTRVVIACWLFGSSNNPTKSQSNFTNVCMSVGLINNIFYVIILTAALDLVGPSIPKATVLLASIVPGLATKIVTPYIIHLVPYSARTLIFAALSTCGMLAVALSPDTTDARSISSKLAGIVLANISSGAGEVSWLSLTHYYGPFSLAAWGSGTGGAGLIGAGAYTLATTIIGFSVRATLLSSALLSIVLLATYFLLLPLEPLGTARRSHVEYAPVEVEPEDADNDDEPPPPPPRAISPAYSHRPQPPTILSSLRTNLHRTAPLIIPYMLPLFLVYLAEYTINQGIAPVLLFPLPSTPFHNYRAFYPTYSTLYQLGVFISRSSLPFLRIRTLYTPTFLQIANLLLLTIHALYPFIPNVWFVFVLVLWEGLLGGLVYVSTFAAIREEVPEQDREFSLGATTVSDSGGIFVAGLLGAGLETVLCNWQVQHGRDWCRRL